jgi:Mrp family chromosome partitioning ATPase
VLLVDGDLRQPDLQRQFGLKEETGLSDLLQDREAAVVATGHQRLELLAAGAPSGRALELPGIDHFREILAEFAGDNRYIVIDCPPLEFSEATVLCGVADDVLLVVRDQHTAKNTLRLAMSRLEPLADKIMGLVVNDEHEAEAVTQGAVLRVVHTGAFTRRGAQPAPMMGAARRGRPPSGKLDEPVVMLGL